MIQNKRILAIVPARGGSKGIPLKNLKPVGGIPLVALTGHFLQTLPEIDRKIVSTDHPEIAKVAEEAGLSVPFFRPDNLSGDRIGDWDVLSHALEEMEKLDGCRYDIVLMLQPTSPLRTADQIRKTIGKLISENFDSVWTVSETNPKFHPLKQLVIKDGQLGFYDARGAGIVARQELSQLYFRNGAAYALTRECLLEQKTIMGRNAGALVIQEPQVNIDTLEDFKNLEIILSSRDKSATPHRP